MINDNIPIKQRLYITFGKFDALVYTSNLDIAKLCERVLRRADLPILYSAGFNQRPRIALATALPLGFSSECEILDVSLREAVPLDGMIERLAKASPPGLRIYKIIAVPVRSPSLPTLVRSSEYRIRLDDHIDLTMVRERIEALIASESFDQQRERKGKTVTVNVRPLIHAIKMENEKELIVHLVVGAEGNMRPDELMTAMGLQDAYLSIHRLRLHLDSSV
ncbi:MAG: TIGR03936 family radical SAM-associated protein [Chloroflexota bacterium]